MLLRVVFLLWEMAISFDKTMCLLRRLLSFLLFSVHWSILCKSVTLPTSFLKEKENPVKRKGVFNKQLRTNEVRISVLHHLHICFVHSKNYLDAVHKQHISHHLCLFSYLYILASHHYFVDLCLLLEDYTEILHVHPPLPPYAAAWVCKCDCAPTQKTTLYWARIIWLWEKIEALNRQIALKFTPAPKLLQKTRTFPGENTSKVASAFTDNWLILIWYYIRTSSDLTDITQSQRFQQEGQF